MSQLDASIVELVSSFLKKYETSQLATALRQYEKNLAYHKEHNKTYNKERNLALRKLRDQQADVYKQLLAEARTELRKQS
jgi:hypothetical protein